MISGSNAAPHVAACKAATSEFAEPDAIIMQQKASPHRWKLAPEKF